ncbi:hypothetical protein RBWH47_01370 [Rhodopirellula baltica WH47]|uniref:Uncharacterized protein n=1 Tax=Rhodopirellula baltica WH47 TaxID=991778 RepID=F2AP44_RHOBT|nr:hypothetical protein RBWH47_01370 [Rhodopirellula baltica WH47]
MAAMPHSPMVNHPKRCKRNVLKLDLLSGTLIVIVEVRSTSDHYVHSIHFVRRSAPSRTGAPQRSGARQAPSGPEPWWPVTQNRGLINDAARQTDCESI